jgi:hypothetical protein
MKLGRVWIGTAVLLLATPVLGQTQAPQDDLAKLQGTWLTVSLVSNGKTLVTENDPPKPGPVTKSPTRGTNGR